MESKLASGCVTPVRSETSHTAFTSPAEMFRTDLITAMKLGDNETLAENDYVIIEDSWKPEWEKGVQVCVKPEHLRRQLALRTTEQLPGKRFVMGSSYILEKNNEWAGHPTRRVYDMDNIDSQWLHALQQKDLKGGKDFDEEKFEAAICFLETKCHENMCRAVRDEVELGIEFDDNVMCAVCRELESEEGNEMVFCDSCNICVHQACYGIREIPEGKWFCGPCATSVGSPSCVLCGRRGGALKPVRIGMHWAHISCALWIPEVKIGNVDNMEPITKIHAIPQSRWNLVCSVCRIRQGACIQCCVPTCTVAFHVECAFHQGLKMRALFDQSVASDGVRHEAFCPRHAVLATSPSSSSHHNPPRSPLQGTQRSRRLELLMENFHQHVSHTDLARKFRLSRDLASSVHAFWTLKRKVSFKVQGNRSLLRLPDPWQVVAEEKLRMFQEEREKEQECVEKARPQLADWELEWERFMTLRQDMEKSRNLSYMLVRRERTKRQLLNVQEELFKKCVVLAEQSCDAQDYSLALAVTKRLHSAAGAEHSSKSLSSLLHRNGMRRPVALPVLPKNCSRPVNGKTRLLLSNAAHHRKTAAHVNHRRQWHGKSRTLSSRKKHRDRKHAHRTSSSRAQAALHQNSRFPRR